MSQEVDEYGKCPCGGEIAPVDEHWARCKVCDDEFPISAQAAYGPTGKPPYDLTCVVRVGANTEGKEVVQLACIPGDQSTAEQLADIERRIVRTRTRCGVRAETITDASVQMFDDMANAPIEPFVRLTQLQSEAVSGKPLTPDERRAKANRKVKNRSKRKASQRARKGARR